MTTPHHLENTANIALAEVAQCLATVKGISVDEVAEVTTGNLSRLLGVSV